jgi:Spy/CpxP family protein refolding chaperone
MSGSKRTILAMTILVAAALLAGAAGLASAGPGPGRHGGDGFGPGGPGGKGGPGGGPFGLGPATRELELTVAQREQLREIAEQQWESGLKAAVEAARTAHEALRAAVENPAATEEQLRAAASATAAPDANLAVAHHKLYLAARSILTTEQQALLQRLQAERDQRRERRQDAVDAWLGGPPRDDD